MNPIISKTYSIPATGLLCGHANPNRPLRTAGWILLPGLDLNLVLTLRMMDLIPVTALVRLWMLELVFVNVLQARLNLVTIAAQKMVSNIYYQIG